MYKGFVERAIFVASPPSIVLEGIKHFFQERNNTVELSVALRDVDVPADFQATHPVRVELESRPNTLLVGRKNDYLALHWSPESGHYPSFDGQIAIRPSSSQTELIVSGEYTPPLGRLGAAFDQRIGKRLAQATLDRLLHELKMALEGNYATLKSVL